MGGMKNVYKILVGKKLMEKAHFEDLGVDGKYESAS
jgi:hypothetical protein